jgi:hypothetical protein
MLKALGAWFGSVAGKVVAIFLGVLIILTVLKWQSIYDGARNAWWGLKNGQAVEHTKTADSAFKAASKDSVAGEAATVKLDALLVEPEIKNNAGAQKVGAAAKNVIKAKNSEIGNLKTAVKEQKAAAESYKAAGEKPEPRIQPYADIGYAVSLTKKYGVPVVRAGVTYRVFGPVHVQGELSYEPPPTISQARATALDAINERDYSRPEIRATVTAHISFR